jgi:hypothetical protein
MANFTVTIDTTKYVAGVRELAEKQLPFVMAKTLTDVVKDGQAEVQRNVDRAFKLRNDWTRKGIRIKPADKKGNSGRIEADVHTDTENRTTGAPDYLGRQEDGGEKVPYGGRHYIAVPTKYLRQMAPGIIPAELRPKALLGAVGGRYTARSRKGQLALRNQVRVRGFVFFLQRIKDGNMAILGRYMTDRDAYPFYLLISSANVKKSALDMEATVERIANDRFPRHWEENWRTVFANGVRL